MKGDGKPVSFIEDCAVALPDLADYTERLNEVFDREGVKGTWYAHASVGCLHVRPVLNMKDGADVARMRRIAEACFALVREYKGSHSGEHGDGIVRSEFHAAMFGPRVAPSSDLPTYPWQNKPYRIETTSEAIGAISGRPHSLLGARLRRESVEWFNHIDSALVPWLADHKVEDSVVLPAAGFAEMALSAARAWLGVQAVELADFDVVAPLIVEADAARETMVRISPDDHVIDELPRELESPLGLFDERQPEVDDARALVPRAVGVD
jgi:hypothetical protein